MHTIFVDMLVCPACHGHLTWNILEQQDERIEQAETRCTVCDATYPIREGIGLFLLPNLPRNDLWQQVESRLSSYLREHPAVEHQLMDAPVDTLAPADQFLRSMVLADRGALAEARAISTRAFPRLYTPEYLACMEHEITGLASYLSPASWPLVDLASGRGTLIEMLAKQVAEPVIASDFSPTVLRRNRRQLEVMGLVDRVTLLAFDARRTPFKQGAVKTMTTLLGLSNIESPAPLLQELRRIVSGSLLAIVHFFPEDDAANSAAIHTMMDHTFLFRRSALEQFTAAGWHAVLTNACSGQAQPTPSSVIFPGTHIDGLPVAETTLEWSILVAH